MNGLLPCGWVYVFMLGSVATKDPLYGTILLAVFWLGTVPALTVFPIFYKKIFDRFPKKLNQIAVVTLVIVGLANVVLIIALHIMPAITSIHRL